VRGYAVDLRGARLDETLLMQAQLEGADLTGASMRGATLDNTNLNQSRLGQVNADGAKASHALIHGTTGAAPELFKVR